MTVTDDMPADLPMMFRAGRGGPEQPEEGSEQVAMTAMAGAITYLADISEFQPNIADAAYLRWSRAIIFRAMYGSGKVDSAWHGGARRDALHAGGARFIGIYQYVRAGQDIITQANAFASLVGKIRPGEKMIADIEEGGGSQRGRRDAWCKVIQDRLGDPDPWVYSGYYFSRDTGIAPVDWVAAYQRSEPPGSHTLWQFTDRFSVPGVGSADCSLFHGTIDQLAAMAFGGKAPQQQDWTEQAVMALPTLKQGSADTAGHIFYVHRMQALAKVVGQVNGLKPAAVLVTDGTFGAETTAAVKACQAFFGFTGNQVDGIVGPNTWRKLIGA